MANSEDVPKLIKKISKASGKKEKEIQELIEKRKEATHGLLSDYGALYAVAKEFNIPLEEDIEVKCSKISEIVPEKPCNILARVTAVYPPKEFKRKDGSAGKMASISLMDNSGECRLVLWNESSDVIKRLSKSDILMVRNANCKSGLNGGVELHATTLTHFTVNPKVETPLPEIKENFSKIKDIKINDKNVITICRISSYRQPTGFNRKDGSSGMRASFVGEDDSGTVRVVLWGENAKAELKRGDVVRIENAYAKEGLNQETELHVSSMGRILKTDKKLNLPELQETKDQQLKINEVTAESSGFTTSARVLTVFSQRPYAGGNFASLIIADTTGSIRAVLWDDRSNIVGELKKGDAIKLKNVYAKSNLNNEQEIHAGKFSEIALDKDSDMPKIEEIEKSLVKDKKINSLNASDRYAKITGKIVDIDAEKRLTYMTCPNCNKKIQNLGMGWYCDVCGEEVEPKPNLVLSFTLEDDTGSIRAVSFRDEAEKILGIDMEEIMNIIGETQDETAPVKKLKDDILNTEVSLIGRVRYSNFSDRLEFLVANVLE